MRKLLTILSTITLFSTATTSVVACGSSNDHQNTNIKFSTYQSWVSASKENSNVSIVFIGGRENSDTYSYLSALNQWVYGTVPVVDKTFDSDNVNNPTKAISAVRKNIDLTQLGATSYQRKIRDAILSSTITPPIDAASLDNEDNNEWYGVESAQQATSIALNTILVNDITTFWKSSNLGKNIITDLFDNQFEAYWEFMQAKSTTPNDDADQSSDTVKSLAKTKRLTDFNTMIKDGSGPYFLVFRNGKLINMTSGYANYFEYNPDLKNDGTGAIDVYIQAANDLSNLFSYLVGSATRGYGSWVNQTYAQFNAQTNKSIWASNKDLVDTWTNRTFVGTNNIPDSSALTNLNNSNDDSSAKLVYNLDWQKYK